MRQDCPDTFGKTEIWLKIFDTAWYVVIKNKGKVNTPDTFGKTEIWLKIFEYYKYYYDKYRK